MSLVNAFREMIPSLVFSFQTYVVASDFLFFILLDVSGFRSACTVF